MAEPRLPHPDQLTTQQIEDLALWATGRWPVPPTIDGPDGGPLGIWELRALAALGARGPEHLSIESAPVSAPEPEVAARPNTDTERAVRRQDAFDRLTEAEDRLARARSWQRRRAAGLVVSVLVATGSSWVGGLVAWWAGAVPMAVSVLAAIVMTAHLLDFDGCRPSWTDLHGCRGEVAEARRRYNRITTEDGLT